MTFPWETAPETVAQPASETIAAMQRDLAYMVTHTAVLVHSTRSELRMMVNTPRGQIIPTGQCKFVGGATVEFQDIGMPQPGADEMSVADLVLRVWATASEIGLELEQ